MRKRIIAALALLLFALAVYGFGVGLGTQVRLVFFTQNPAPVGAASNTPASAVAELQGQVHDMAEDAKRTDRLVTLLLAVASLYAIALGLHSYFGLQQITATAEREAQRAVKLATEDSKRVIDAAERDSKALIQHAKEEFDRFHEDIRERYPEMANIRANLRELIGNVALFQARDNWSEYTWDKLTERVREETVMAESWFSVLEVFGLFRLNSYRAEITSLYHGFARFYFSKYSINPANRADWERAGLYFSRALEHSEPNAELLKDYGVHLTQVEVTRLAEIDRLGGVDHFSPRERMEIERLRDQAEAAFVKSVGLKPNECGSMFGLGWILYRKKNYKSAIGWYGQVIETNPISKADRKKYLADAYRNRACCIWLETRNSSAAFDDLEASGTVAEQYGELRIWKDSMRKDSDLTAIWVEDPARSQQILA